MIKIAKGAAELKALALLRSFLDPAEPVMVRFLTSMWRDQAAAITYREIRDAIRSGDLTEEYLNEWRQDYGRFVIENLRPQWEAGMDAAAVSLKYYHPTLIFDRETKEIREWIDQRGGQLITNISTLQHDAVKDLIKQAAVTDIYTVDELSRAIRPLVGLTKPQSNYLLKFYKKLRADGKTDKAAQKKQLMLSDKLHRERAFTIARTELAFGYNKGMHESVLQAHEQGLIGKTDKVWVTAEDERVCDVCGSLNGKRIAQDNDFEIQGDNAGYALTPPAHPRCRCAVMYKELDEED